MRRGYTTLIATVLFAGAQFAVPICYGQQQPKLSGDQRAMVSNILRDAHDEVKKHYYDPKFQGLDWDARYQVYQTQLPKIQTVGEGFRLVAAYLGELKDSHTFFAPPERISRLDYGYRSQIVGDACFITQIRPNTDADSKLHVGDRVIGLNGYGVNREDFHDLTYYLNALAPQASLRFDLLSPTGVQRQVVVNALVHAPKIIVGLQAQDYYDLVRRIEGEDHAMRSKLVEDGDAAIWSIQEFDLDIDQIEKGIGIARKHKTLILDLRGNPGGYVDSLERMVGMLFNHEIKISDRVGRKQEKPQISKPGGKPFDGKLIVLVDARSASAAELLARVVQLEHRGTVIGDRTSGAVMEAKFNFEAPGTEIRVFYGFSVTESNLIMSDGKSLEKIGVTPDELILPTGADLAAGRDPVLAHAAEEAGVKLDPVAAGKMFPFEWPPL